MSIDESKMSVDSSFSFLNLRKQHTNLKLKLLFKIKTQNPSHWAKSLHYHFSLNGFTSQPHIHKLGLTVYETNTKNHPLFEY